jgi:hypothetical protein
MPNPDAEHLIDQAVRLTRPLAAGPPRQTDLRRAISSAYYAVFHMTLGAAADAVIGRTRRGTPAYALAYRSIEHKSLRTICDMVRRQPPPLRYRRYLPEPAFGPDLRAFARSTIELQEERYAADYDPTDQFPASRAGRAINVARAALHHWAAAPETERRSLLMLLLFPPR